MTETTIGIDISKATLDVHRLSDGTAAQFGNDKAGFRALEAWLKGHDIARVVYEPTGPYHRNFEIALEANYPLAKVNPLQARRFAQSRGTKAKTDPVDARMLAMMGAAFSLLPQQRTSAKQRDLKELHVTRLALIKDRTRILNRQKSLTIALSQAPSESAAQVDDRTDRTGGCEDTGITAKRARYYPRDRDHLLGSGAFKGQFGSYSD